MENGVSRGGISPKELSPFAIQGIYLKTLYRERGRKKEEGRKRKEERGRKKEEGDRMPRSLLERLDQLYELVKEARVGVHFKYVALLVDQPV